MTLFRDRLLFKAALAAMGLIVFGTWLGESVVQLISPWLPGLWFELLLSLVGLFLLLLWAWSLGTRLCSVQTIRPLDAVEPRKVLILCCSPSRPKILNLLENPRGDGGTKSMTVTLAPRGHSGTPVVLPLQGRLDADIKDIANLEKQDKQWNWEQLLRGLKPHLGIVERIYLIGSMGDDGSYQELEQIRSLLALYVAEGLPIELMPETDFDEPMAVFRSIEKAVGLARRVGCSQSDIVIDVTGGQKVVSIAGAMATLHCPKIIFQYVDTKGDKQVRGFNVTAASHESLSAS